MDRLSGYRLTMQSGYERGQRELAHGFWQLAIDGERQPWVRAEAHTTLTDILNSGRTRRLSPTGS